MWYSAGYGSALLAEDKTEGPTSSIKFLGIEIDSQAMECCLPDDKLYALKDEVCLASENTRFSSESYSRSSVSLFLHAVSCQWAEFFVGMYWLPLLGLVRLFCSAE